MHAGFQYVPDICVSDVWIDVNEMFTRGVQPIGHLGGINRFAYAAGLKKNSRNVAFASRVQTQTQSWQLL